MRKFRFLEWKVYKDAKELFSLLLKIVKRLPREYRFELGSQNEVLSAVDVLKDNKFITKKEFDKIFKKIDEISNQLGGFKKVVRL